MAKVSRSGKMRKQRKAKKSLTKKQANAVKTIAKRVVSSEAETKYFPYTGSKGLTVDQFTSWNLFYHGVSTGTTNNTLIGDKLEWRGIKIKYVVQNTTDGGTTWNPNPFTVHFMIIGTPVYKALTTLTPSEVCTDTSGYFGLGYLQPDAKMLFKKSITINAQSTTALTDKVLKSGSLWLSRRQKINYTDLIQDYKLTKMNYYFVTYCEAAGSGNVGYIDFTWQNYFKDS